MQAWTPPPVAAQPVELEPSPDRGVVVDGVRHHNLQPFSGVGRLVVSHSGRLLRGASSIDQPPSCEQTFCCGAACAAFSCGVLILAVVLFVSAATLGDDAEGLDPDADFRSLGAVCNITSTEHTAQEDEVYCKGPGDVVICSDGYSWTFTVPGEGEWRSVATPAERRCSCENCKCAKSEPDARAQLFATGETVECWAPVGDRESLHDAYECPNDKCYRVVDPAKDVELYAETAAGYLYGAWACLALALIGFCAIAVCSSEGACLCAEGGPKVGMRNTNSRTHPGD